MPELSIEHALTLQAETPRPMHAAQELAVLRGAIGDGPAPAPIRRRLALLLHQLDAFDDAIALLDSVADEVDTDERLLLAAAWLARGAPEDLSQASAYAEAARAGASTHQQEAAALVVQAKAFIRMGRPEASVALLHEALTLDAGNVGAFSRLTAHLLRADDPAAALGVTALLIARGAGHSGLFAVRATALARLGEHDAARRMLGLADLLAETTIDTPPGWVDLAAFNAALADELSSHSGLRYERDGTTSVGSWRIESLMAGDAPLARLLIEQIITSVQSRTDALAGIDHPWVAAMPRRAVLHSWCVIAEQAGYEAWHMHPFGWMSGVYYVAVPDAMSVGTTEGGLMLGLSDRLAGEAGAAAVGHHLLRPRAGLLATFPSHTYHRTFPHGAPGKRICVAFDVRGLA